MKAPLTAGAYEARSYIANAQRCVNLYTETNAEDAPFPTTCYPTAGLSLIQTLPAASTVRCLYTASNGMLFAACRNKVYFVSESGWAQELGTIGVGTTPVSMSDNDTYLMVVDGSTSGWVMQLADFTTWAAITDPNFLGGDIVIFTDTFFVLNQPGTQFFYCSDSDSIVFNGLAIAGKTDYQDLLQAIMFTNQRFWLLGAQRGSELWYNAGQSPFPFQQVPGVGIEWACWAKYSPDFIGTAVFWLGCSPQGQNVVIRGEGQNVVRISTFAIENTLNGYSRTDDAVSWTYQLDGHSFYVLCFPSANAGLGATWAWDDVEKKWHEWGYTNTNGELERHRGNCHAVAYGKHYVGDHSNGKLYELSLSNLDDAGQPITRVRSWPHFVIGYDFQRQPISAEGKTIIYDSFMAEMATGAASGTSSADGDDPSVSLRWSTTKGASWGNPVSQTLGAAGDYVARPFWRSLGLGADVVFEISWSGAVATALNGAYVDSRVLGK